MRRLYIDPLILTLDGDCSRGIRLLIGRKREKKEERYKPPVAGSDSAKKKP
jgi:hypothetical protein